MNIQPVDPVLFENQSLNLTCIATSASPLTFSWLRDGVSLPGENESVLSVLSVPVEWEGSVLVCVVEGVGNSSVTLTVRRESPATQKANSMVDPLPCRDVHDSTLNNNNFS